MEEVAGASVLRRPRKSTQLRDLLKQPGVLIIPGVYDCISLRIVERVGFKVAWQGGYNSSASFLGMPDVGLLTMTETIECARNMAATVDIPVLCDVDTGFGDINNVMRATREVIRSGLAGMLIEDQVFPKRCPALGGGGVVPMEVMIRKLRAVARVREEEDPDLVVVARTHASLTMGLEEGIKRGIAYAKEGGDIIFVDHGYDEKVIDDLKVMAEEIGPHAHLLANMTENIGRPLLTVEELYGMGFKVAMYGLTAIMAAAAAVTLVMKELQKKGITRALVDRMMPVDEFGRLMGIDDIRDVEKEFGIKR